MLQPWSGHQGAVAVFCFSVFKMHVLSSLQSQHPLGSSSDLSHFRYTLSSTKLPPLPSSPEKNQTGQNSNLKLKMESGVDKRMLSHCELIAFFFFSFEALPGVLDHPAAQAGMCPSAICQGWKGWFHCRCRMAAGQCPVPVHPIPFPASFLPSPHSCFLHYFCCRLLAASAPATEEEEEARADKTVFLLHFSLAMQTFAAAKNSIQKEVCALDL